MAVTQTLRSLERDGLVDRRRDSPDRRIVTVDLTAEGRAQVAEAIALRSLDRRAAKSPDASISS